MIGNYIAYIFTPAGFVDFIGLLIAILISLYCIFAVIVVKQVALLNRSFKTHLALFFTMLAYIHFFLALSLVLLSLFILVIL